MELHQIHSAPPTPLSLPLVCSLVPTHNNAHRHSLIWHNCKLTLGKNHIILSSPTQVKYLHYLHMKPEVRSDHRTHLGRILNQVWTDKLYTDHWWSDLWGRTLIPGLVKCHILLWFCCLWFCTLSPPPPPAVICLIQCAMKKFWYFIIYALLDKIRPSSFKQMLMPSWNRSYKRAVLGDFI